VADRAAVVGGWWTRRQESVRDRQDGAPADAERRKIGVLLSWGAAAPRVYQNRRKGKDVYDNGESGTG